MTQNLFAFFVFAAFALQLSSADCGKHLGLGGETKSPGNSWNTVGDGTAGKSGDCTCPNNDDTPKGKDCKRYNETDGLCSCRFNKPASSPITATEQSVITYTIVGNVTDFPVLNVTDFTLNASESSTVAANSTCGSDLIDALQNMTQSGELSVSECETVNILIRECREILIDVTISIELKIKLVGKKLKLVFENNKELCKKIRFKNVGEFGYLIEVVYQANIRQMRYTDALVTVEGDSCAFVDAFQNASLASSDSQYQSCISEIVYSLKFLLKFPDWSFNQIKGTICVLIKNLIKKYPQYKKQILEIEIKFPGSDEVYGDVEIFLEACEKYQQFTTVSQVVGGSASNCSLIQAMDKVVANTNYTTQERSQCKQLRDKLAAYFIVHVSIEERVAYINQQCDELFKIAPWMKQLILSIEITNSDGSSWGIFMDVTFTALACDNYGCGNLSAGPGQFPSCGDRLRLIEVNATSDTTLFEVSIEKVVATWSSTEKLKYSSLRNSFKSCIRSLVQCPEKGPSECRCKCINKAIDTYCTNNPTQKQKFLAITIQTWFLDVSFSATSTTGKFYECVSQG